MQRKKGNFLHCGWNEGCFIPYLKYGRFLKILKMDLAHNPAISLLGIYLMNTETLIKKETCAPVYCSTVYNKQTMKTTKFLDTDK